MNNRFVVILAGAKARTTTLYNSLKNDFHISKVIIEKPVPRAQFLKKRIKRLGLIKVLGQILFRILVVPILNWTSRKHIAELKKRFCFDGPPINESIVSHVTSINSEETIDLLKNINPKVVVVSGTRIISEKVLNCIPAKFINTHAGITPLYRGVHGAYWSLVEKNRKTCGVTVHLVDTGIDTGNILEQQIIEPTEKDNFVTYPLHQLNCALPLLKKAIKNALEDRFEIKSPPEGESKLWTHPTIWQYLWYRVCYGVK